MKAPIRLHYFFWLTGIIFVGFLFETTAFLAYEIHEWKNSGHFDYEEELPELAIQVGVDLLVLPVMIILVWFVSKRMLRPLRTIAQTAHEIGSGHFEERIPIEKHEDEIGMLARAINGAFDRYNDAVSRLQRFTSDASHQLRTPLTAIRSTGEVTLQKPRSDTEYREAIGSMLEDVERLSKITEKLLMLARLETVEIRKQFHEVNFGDVMHQAVGQFAGSWEDKKITLSVRTAPDCLVKGDEYLLQQVVANLLDNAIRHTPRGGQIDLSADRSAAGTVTMVVADSGPGIPANFRERIFERFHRLPGLESTGSGLGLAIVADIVKVHDGTIGVSASQQLGGAEFRVELPPPMGR